MQTRPPPTALAAAKTTAADAPRQTQAEIVAARGDIDVAATLRAVAEISPAANLIRNAAHCVAQRLPGPASGAGRGAGARGAASTRAASTRPVTASGAAFEAGREDPAAAAALAAAQEHWQRLITDRLAAAQKLLPDLPIASAPRSDQEMQRLRQQGW